jgi:hypothetical protein
MSDVYMPPPAMRCALIQSNVVVNLIMAMPDDPPPRNFVMVCDIPDFVVIGTKYDPTTGFKESVEGTAQ